MDSELRYDGHHIVADADPHHEADVDSPFYWQDNVVIVSIGIDIGSSTSHLSFSRLKLRREMQGLSSRFVVVARSVLWESAITLTPYTPDGAWIDAAAIGAFVGDAYAAAGLRRADVDTGIVILTGQALKRENSRAIADAVSAQAGDFVCVAAGDHFEAVLSAFGSGAAELSRTSGRSVLCVDIGGGTTKLSLSRAGRVRTTGILTIGARLLSWDVDTRVIRARAPELDSFAPAGVTAGIGEVLSEADEQVIADAAAATILAVVAGETGTVSAAPVVAGSDFSEMGSAESITFSGGVAEYVFGREAANFGDLGRAIGRAVRERVATATPAEVVVTTGGIRATVVGASQYSVQVSGNTVTASSTVRLPLRNVPVMHPHVADGGGAGELARAIARELDLHRHDMRAGVAFSVPIGEVPAYQRLCAVAEGLATGLEEYGVPSDTPVVLLLDKDVAQSVGQILIGELGLRRPLVCLDNLALDELDFVDVGEPIQPAGVYPVVVKSLLFSASPVAPA